MKTGASHLTDLGESTLRKPVRGGLLAAMLLGCLCASTAPAQIIFNTGIDNNNDGRDDHYRYLGTTTTVGILPSPVLGGQALIDPGIAFPITTGNWFANTEESSWLRPGTLISQATAPSNNGLVESIFVFKTSFYFDDTAYNYWESSITFKAAADNMLSVYLNDGGSALFGSGELHTFFLDFTSSFTLNFENGLARGNNDLYFYVTNIAGVENSNPSGFRLEVDTVLTDLTPIPEPSTYGLIGVGVLGGLVWLRRRKSRQAQVVEKS